MHLIARNTISVHRFDAASKTWDDCVERWEAANFCHLSAWREILEDVMGLETLYWIARDEGRPVGLLPLVRVRSRLFGHYLVSMPFLSYGGPIGTPAAQARLTEAAVKEARRSGADLLELRARHRLPTSLRVSDRKIAVVLELPEDAETLWRDRFSTKLRNTIRRPLKRGLKTRFGCEQMEAFYEVFSRHMRDLGTPVMPRAWFERIRDRFGVRALFAAVYDGREAVAAGCGFLWGDEFEITWASALLEHKRDAPNMLLYWSLMQEMIRRGVRRFNFGRCTPGSGTHHFKRQWGSADVALPWVQWSGDGVLETPSPERPLYRIATGVWRRLPLALTNRLGPQLVRKLP